MNLSLLSGHFPTEWKTAHVHPLQKNTTPTSLCDYQPISILPTLSKVLEKVVRSQINNYLERNNILNENQHGFRAGRSTGTALL